MENPRKRILTVLRSGLGVQQIWHMLEETNDSISTRLSLLYFDKETMKRLQQCCAGRCTLFVHPSLHGALKLTFSFDIVGLSPDGFIRSEMSLGSMGQAVGNLTPTMFNAVEQP